MVQLVDRVARRLFGSEVLNNDMYGHAKLLRRYCRVALPAPINGLLQHGWSFGPGLALCHPDDGWLDRSTRLFLWSDRNLDECRRLGYHAIEAIGSPLLYLQVPSVTVKPEPRSLLLFPAHSVDSEPYLEDGRLLFSRYLDEIEPVTRDFSPVTVCLYYREYDDPRIRRELAERGLTTTTLGHRDHTPDFVSKLRDLILGHEYVSTNSYSTALFYALYLGRRTFVHGQTFANRLWPAKTDSLIAHAAMERRYPQLSWESFNHEPHVDIGAEEVGVGHLRSAAELRALFGWEIPQLVTTATNKVGSAVRRRISRRGRDRPGHAD